MELRKNWFFYIIILILALMIVFDGDDSQPHKDRVKELEELFYQKELENTIIQDSANYYKDLSNKYKAEAKSLENELNNFKNTRNEIPTKVNNYTPSKLDSILSNYRHPRGD